MKKPFKNSSDKVIIRFGEKEIRADIAGSYLKRAIGISFRKSLIEDGGMLFVFQRLSRPVFWNFGMRFPIDVVWIRENKVVGIEKSVPAALLRIKIFYPREKIDSALELPAGSIDKLNILTHSIIEII